MRLGDVVRVAVEGTDLVLVISVRWGEYKRIVRDIVSKPEAESLPGMDAFLRKVVVGISGLVGDDGQPVKWQPDVLDEIPPGVVLAMFQACVKLGEAGSGDPLPATVDAEPSAS